MVAVVSREPCRFPNVHNDGYFDERIAARYDESAEEMFDIAEDPSIIYEHVWRVGDLVMWDNLACLHARTDWPSEQRRTLRRCTVEGEPLYE